MKPTATALPRLLAATLALLGAGAVQAQDATTVPLCFTDFPPYVSAELPNGGSLGALARRAFVAAGLQVQAIKVPWARAFAMARKGECLLLALWRNEERDTLFRYSLPVARMELGFFVKSERSAVTLAADARVAFQRGSYLPPELAAGSYRLDPVVGMHPALKMLKLGRVEAVFSERASFEHLLGREQITGISWLAPPLEVKTTFMAISKSHPQADAWLEILNHEIQRSVRD